GGINFQRGIVLNHAVEQQILIKVAQGRKFARNRAVFHGIGKQLTQKCANVVAAGLKQVATPGFEKFGELNQGGVRGGERWGTQTFLDLEVVEKTRYHALVRGGHTLSMNAAPRGANNEGGTGRTPTTGQSKSKTFDAEEERKRRIGGKKNNFNTEEPEKKDAR